MWFGILLPKIALNRQPEVSLDINWLVQATSLKKTSHISACLDPHNPVDLEGVLVAQCGVHTLSYSCFDSDCVRWLRC